MASQANRVLSFMVSEAAYAELQARADALATSPQQIAQTIVRRALAADAPAIATLLPERATEAREGASLPGMLQAPEPQVTLAPPERVASAGPVLERATDLTAIEQKMVRSLRSVGCTPREIARELGLSVEQVRGVLR